MYTKNINFILLLCLFVFTFIQCSSDDTDDVINGDQDDDTPIYIGGHADGDIVGTDLADGELHEIEPDDTPDGDADYIDSNDSDILEQEAELDITEQELDSDSLDNDLEENESPLTSCNFDYPFIYDDISKYNKLNLSIATKSLESKSFRTDQVEPKPSFLYTAKSSKSEEELIYPEYTNNLPLFERANDWNGEKRCFELPRNELYEDIAIMLSESEAYDLYRYIAELGTGNDFVTANGRRQVISFRGAYPGSFRFHGNRAERFNDTIVLLWQEANGTKRVKEFMVNTEPSSKDFGVDSSSHLRPNRSYHYINGLHSGYSALRIAETGYITRNETNKNGHWDSDRNGWLPPDDGTDYFRVGSLHNIHMGSIDSPIWTADVYSWSAGCQVIPGTLNWLEFIDNAWTGLSDPVTYYLLDVRDLSSRAFNDCIEDGSMNCPFEIDSLPFYDERNTNDSPNDIFDNYNCLPNANEGGAEFVYTFTVHESGTLYAGLDDISGDQLDMDIHLLDGTDNMSCISRSNTSLEEDIEPGRYWLVVDTFVNESGFEMAGEFRLDVVFY